MASCARLMQAVLKSDWKTNKICDKTNNKDTNGTQKDNSERQCNERRNLRYDSVDSSDSGVSAGGTSWSPCSSVTYSPPPLLSDADDDAESKPSAESLDEAVNGMAPNDASRLCPDTKGDILTDMGQCALETPQSPRAFRSSHILNVPIKDKPPDDFVVSRLNSVGCRPAKRRSTDSPKADRRTKSPRNGQSPNAALLARLVGLPTARKALQKDTLSPTRMRTALQTLKKLSVQNGRNFDSKSDNLTINNNVNSTNKNIPPDSIGNKITPTLLYDTSPSYPSPPPDVLSRLSGESSDSSNFVLSTVAVSPKLRFPAPKKKDSAGDVCKWKGCVDILDQSISLLEHIQAVHVEGQLECESFRCLWIGCKVFERPSCSVSWLERHVLTHGGHKPFKCIVDGCGQRFTSQTALGRHVNHHFNGPVSGPTPRPNNQPSPTKLVKKNGRKVRFRKRPFSARNFDFFDVNAMEQVRWGLLQVSKLQRSLTDDFITLKPKVLGKRVNSKKIAEVLVEWTPKDLLPNEWMEMSKVQPRDIHIRDLDGVGKAIAFDLYCPHIRPTKHNQRKRPPVPSV